MIITTRRMKARYILYIILFVTSIVSCSPDRQDGNDGRLARVEPMPDQNSVLMCKRHEVSGRSQSNDIEIIPEINRIRRISFFIAACFEDRVGQFKSHPCAGQMLGSRESARQVDFFALIFRIDQCKCVSGMP